MTKESLINQLLSQELVVNWSLSKASDFFKKPDVSIAMRDGWLLLAYHSKDYMKVSIAKDGMSFIRERQLRDADADIVAEATGLEFGIHHFNIEKRYVTQYLKEHNGKVSEISQDDFLVVLENLPEQLIEALAIRESKFMSSITWSRFCDRVRHGLA